MKTLEQKFLNYLNNVSYACNTIDSRKLARIAKEHFNELGANKDE